MADVKICNVCGDEKPRDDFPRNGPGVWRPDCKACRNAPVVTFDLTDPAQVREAFAPTNHQWLTRAANRVKWAKVG